MSEVMDCRSTPPAKLSSNRAGWAAPSLCSLLTLLRKSACPILAICHTTRDPHWESLPANSYRQMWHQQNQQLVLHVRDLPWACGSLQFETAHCDESASRTCRAQFSVAGDNAYLSFRQDIGHQNQATHSSEIRTLLPKSGPRGTGKPNWWSFGDQSPMG